MTSNALNLASPEYDYFLHYCVVESSITVEGDNIACYGVQVLKFNIHGELTAEATAPALTPNRFIAYRLTQQYERFGVTPCTLLDIAEDYID